MKRDTGNRKKAVKWADKWCSLYIRKRDPLCYCGKPTEQAGHLITRSSYSTRWTELNLAGCCSGCNMKHEYHPEDYTNWFLKKYGISEFDKLVSLGHSVFKITTGELWILGDDFKSKYEELCK